MDIDARLAAIEENQRRILQILTSDTMSPSEILSLKEAASYTGYSPDHFRRLAVEQRIIPFVRPSGVQKGKLLFRKADLDDFLNGAKSDGKRSKEPGRRRKSSEIRFW